MDHQRVGTALRVIRIRKRLRQKDLAGIARVSRTMLVRIEHGRLDSVPVGSIDRVARALDARFDLVIRWQGGDLGRLLNARHSAMHEVMARVFSALDGWLADPEVSFSIYGERGVIDILAWHAATRTLLVIELKTELVDVNDLMSSSDRRRRLAVQIARQRGWDPSSVSTWVVLADSRTNRRALANHATVLRAKFPVDGRGVRRWLGGPTGAINGLSFLPSVHAVTLGRDLHPIRRVARPRSVQRKRESGGAEA